MTELLFLIDVTLCVVCYAVGSTVATVLERVTPSAPAGLIPGGAR